MSKAQQGLLPVFGAASFGFYFNTQDEVKEVLKVLKENDCHHIDTAIIYGQGKSEELIGDVGAGGPQWNFNIDTKAPGGFGPGSGTREAILQQAKESHERLKADIDVFYLHAPDTSIPIEGTLAGINDAHKAGHFKRFGISNFETAQVQQVYDHCKKNGYILPTVFQGNYNPVARRIDDDLLPLLRKLGIAFYAYSPSAGGVLSRPKEVLIQGGEGSGRFDEKHPFGAMYRHLYHRPSILAALDEWGAAAEAAGISRIELAYRWVTFNSPLKREHGDAIIFGTSKLPQVQNTLDMLNKGPLDDATVKKIDHVWQLVKDEAPLNNMDFMKK